MLRSFLLLILLFTFSYSFKGQPEESFLLDDKNIFDDSISDNISDQIKYIIVGFNKLLDFFISDYKNVGADGLFGIIVAEGHLNMILKENERFTGREDIIILRDKCHTAIELIRPLLKAYNNEIYQIIRQLLHTDLWEMDINFTNGSLFNLSLHDWNRSDMADVMFDGHPDEKLSDLCISEVATSGDPRQEHACAHSPPCNVMFDVLTSHGYPLTHKLLYLQVRKQVNCIMDTEKVEKRIYILCSKILQEFRFFEKIDCVLTRDLYVEQMVLCGMEGYEEFLTKKARENLLSWQSTAGCYGSSQEAASRRTKRHVMMMREGCSDHFSGLVAAAFALHLRDLVFIN